MIWNWQSSSLDEKEASHGSQGFYRYFERLRKLGHLKHADVTGRIISVLRRLLFDDERKKIRENPCESVAEVLNQ